MRPSLGSKADSDGRHVEMDSSNKMCFIDKAERNGLRTMFTLLCLRSHRAEALSDPFV